MIPLLWRERTESTSVLLQRFWRRGSLAGFHHFYVARENGPGWIGWVILIGWKYATTITVKLIYAPNENTKFFSATDSLNINVQTNDIVIFTFSTQIRANFSHLLPLSVKITFSTNNNSVIIISLFSNPCHQEDYGRYSIYKFSDFTGVKVI